jgi:alanyl-tRNA synthetase
MVPGVSVELCGGTHVRHTADIGLFRITTETGVAAGVRRVEAVTGTAAYHRAVAHEDLLERAAAAVKTTPDTLLRRLEQLLEENRDLRRQLERARQTGSADLVAELIAGAEQVDGASVIASELQVGSGDELRSIGDRLRDRLGSGAAVLAGRHDDRVALIAIVTDDLIERGVRADALVREVAQATGGSGGGRPQVARGGVGDAALLADAFGRVPQLVRAALGATAGS